MQITSRFTIAIHAISCIEHFGKDGTRITSEFIANSSNVNPVIVRTVLGQLKKSGIISSRQGSGGFKLAKPLSEITFYDIYKSVDCVKDEGLFNFHENPNPECAIGKNIHASLDGELNRIQENLENDLKSVTIEKIVSDIESRIKEGEE